MKAVQYYLGTFGLNFSSRGVVTGASYTDVNAQLPALRLLAIISIISAILFIANIRFRRLALPIAAVGIWVLHLLPAASGRHRPTLFGHTAGGQSRAALHRAKHRGDTGWVTAWTSIASLCWDRRPQRRGSRGQRDPAEQRTGLGPRRAGAVYNQLQAITPFYTFPTSTSIATRSTARRARSCCPDESCRLRIDYRRVVAERHLIYTHGYGLARAWRTNRR